MRVNRPLEEYISMLRVDIDTLQAAKEHLESAKVLYQTKFMDIGCPYYRHCIRWDIDRMDYSIRSTNECIKGIEQQIELAKSKNERRKPSNLWRKNFLAWVASGEEFPF